VGSAAQLTSRGNGDKKGIKRQWGEEEKGGVFSLLCWSEIIGEQRYHGLLSLIIFFRNLKFLLIFSSFQVYMSYSPPPACFLYCMLTLFEPIMGYTFASCAVCLT